MYKELVVYLCSHCVLTGSAASTDATIAKLFGKYLLAEHEYTETDSSSDSLVFWKHSQSSEDLRSFAIPSPTSSAPVESCLVLRPNRERMNVRFKLLSELTFLKSAYSMSTLLETSSSRMRVINHNWSATKQRPHPQSVAEISRHSVLSGNRIRQCETSSGSRHRYTDQCL